MNTLNCLKKFKKFFMYSNFILYIIIYIMHLFYFLQRAVHHSIFCPFFKNRIKKCVAEALVFIIKSKLYINY